MTDFAAPQSFATMTEFRIGAVLSRSARLLIRRAPGLLLISLIVAVPQIIVEFALGSGSAWARAALILVRSMTGQVAQIAMSYLILRELQGQRSTIVDSITVGFRRFLPAFLTGLISVLLIGLGMILLIVPGMIVTIMFSVAIPACVMEQLGPVAALKRSAALTKGHRWRIFGLYSVLILIFLAFGLAAGFLLVGLLAQSGFGMLARASTQVLTGIVVSPISAVLLSVLYNDLRVARDGVAGLGDLTHIFE